jgi:hypothetical protein
LKSSNFYLQISTFNFYLFQIFSTVPRQTRSESEGGESEGGESEGDKNSTHQRRKPPSTRGRAAAQLPPSSSEDEDEEDFEPTSGGDEEETEVEKKKKKKMKKKQNKKAGKKTEKKRVGPANNKKERPKNQPKKKPAPAHPAIENVKTHSPVVPTPSKTSGQESAVGGTPGNAVCTTDDDTEVQPKVTPQVEQATQNLRFHTLPTSLRQSGTEYLSYGYPPDRPSEQGGTPTGCGLGMRTRNADSVNAESVNADSVNADSDNTIAVLNQNLSFFKESIMEMKDELRKMRGKLDLMLKLRPRLVVLFILFQLFIFL